MRTTFSSVCRLSLLGPLLLSLLGCGSSGGPKPTPGSAGNASSTTASPKEFTLSAKEFFDEYKKDQGAAKDKFANKTVNLKGTVAGYGLNFGGEAYISLAVDKEPVGVMVFTSDRQPWAMVAPGTPVSVRGMGQNFGNPALVHADVVATGPNTAISLNEAALASEYAKDIEGTNKKYDEKHIIVEGEVIEKQVAKEGNARVCLKGNGKTRVCCMFAGLDKDVTERIAVGQRLKFIGEYSGTEGERPDGLKFKSDFPPGKLDVGSHPRLSRCLPIFPDK